MISISIGHLIIEVFYGDFGEIFFFQHTSEPFNDCFFQLGLQLARWSTAAIANTWLQDQLFHDIESIKVPTLIIHGIHDKVVPS